MFYYSQDEGLSVKAEKAEPIEGEFVNKVRNLAKNRNKRDI